MESGMAAARSSCSRCLSTSSTTVVGTPEVRHGDFGLEWRRLRRLSPGLGRRLCSVRVLFRSDMASWLAAGKISGREGGVRARVS